MTQTQQKIYIYGKHAVAEALRHTPQAVDKVILAGRPDDENLAELIKSTGVAVGNFSPDSLPKSVDPEANHQGVLALVDSSRLIRPFHDFLRELEVNADTALVLLGEIQDPQNVGAIIRSAAAFGVAGILIPEHNQAPITGSVVKVSAGMAFRIPLVLIGNVNTTIRDLKDKGFWVYGLDSEAKQNVNAEKFDAPAVFVLGNEAKGIRAKTLELCDVGLNIPIHPQAESLNVAASAAVVLHAWSRERPGALKKDNV
jgi:23S rRNA (guanosine2251-2'-O)-methyltransferase